MRLTPVMRKFVLHWGEMGTRWGINRTVAQIHALLYLAPRPLHAEEIASLLTVARSNVSTSLRELQAWGVVRVVHVLGDRRDHFETLSDVWQMFRIIMDERKKREIDPTLALLEECVAEARQEAEHAAAAEKQRPSPSEAATDAPAPGTDPGTDPESAPENAGTSADGATFEGGVTSGGNAGGPLGMSMRALSQQRATAGSRPAEAKTETEVDGQLTAARLNEMLEFFQDVDRWYRQLRKLPQPAVVKFVRMGKKVPRLLGLKG